jgi:pyruvate/2-oxoglutarate dehydrogenase complex dihydrolipoamide dehydrogenase (E3) component
MLQSLQCDLCVIGGGPGGLTVAASAALFGEKVVLIEKGKMGGDCLNYGCVPSKALIAAAKRAHAFSHSTAFGIAAAKPGVDFAAVMEHVAGVVAAVSPHDSEERFTGLGVTVIRAVGRFTSPETVEAGGHVVRARRFVIATGSSPAVPPIPGLEESGYLTNETLFDNRTLPSRLIVIGAGPIGLEMAQAFRRLGSEVTVLEAFDPLARDDPELAAVVLAELRAEGIEILSRVSVERVEKTASGIVAHVVTGGEKRRIEGSHLLVAAGRRPNVDALGLEAAGIAFDRKGIKVDKALRTSNRRVYAMGDVAGGLQFTHVAGYQGGLVIRSALFRLPVRNATDHIPWVTFTDPELAHVGLSEAAARERYGEVRVLRTPFKDNDRAQAERAVTGLVKVVTDRRGRILGASIVGPEAGELIQPWSLAISAGLNIRAMATTIVAYPTLADINRRVALSYFADLPARPWVRRAIAWLKLLP